MSLLQECKKEIVGTLAARQSQPRDSFALTARGRAGPAPLSFQQECVWSSRGESIWIVPLRLSGVVETEILRRSLATLVGRHEAMRTKFVLVDGIPHQVCDPPGECRLELVAQDCATEKEVMAVFRTFASKVRECWTAIPSGALFHVRLIRTGENNYVFFVAISFMIADMVSVDLLFKELWSVYGQLSRGTCPSLPHLPLQYSDFAAWQRASSQQQFTPYREYWLRRLSGAERIRFPVDSGVQSKQRFRFAAIPASLSEDLSFAVHALARRERTTAAMVMLSLFVGVASNWCRQKDFVIEFNVNGRRRSDLVNVIGRFIEFLPLRIQLNGNETFLELLSVVSQEFFTAYEHVEFANVARALPGLYDGPGGARCQLISGVVLGPTGRPGPTAWAEYQLPFTVEQFPVSHSDVSASTEFELTDGYMAEVRLPMWSTSCGIEGGLLYRADLFRRGTMERFLRQYRLFAERVLQDPHVTVGAVDHAK